MNAAPLNVIRPPAVAGTFYPADERTLRAKVVAYLDAARTNVPAPKAIIAPHAGYVYSGPVAATAYARLEESRITVNRVILLGPAHFVPFEGLAASSAKAFATPLGTVPVDQHSLETIMHMPWVRVLDEAHAREHSLEVHLPFLQETLNDFSIVPLLVGDSTPREVGEVLDTLWGGPETVIVISSDLSHYHDYRTARELDRMTAKAIEELRTEDITDRHACGCGPIRGLLTVARRHNLHVKAVDLRNSGDTAGIHDQVVGYGAFVVE
jgi:AmmeMemoRadiSam system protein B